MKQTLEPEHSAEAPVRRPRVQRAVRREQILRASLELFAEYGYANTTTAAIAERVGVTEPILYQHFKGKKEILMSVLAGTRQKLLQHWQVLVSSIDCPLERIEAICMDWPRLLSRHAHAVRLIDNVLAETRDQEIRDLLRNNYRHYEEFFCSIFDEAKQRGLCRRDINSQIAAWQLISYGKTIGLMRHIGLRGISIPEFVKTTTDQLMRAIRIL